MSVRGKLNRFWRAYTDEGTAFALKLVLHRAAPSRFNSPAPVAPLAPVFSYLRRAESFTIVQIGAYIGETTNDPIASFLKTTLAEFSKSRAKVILVEPVQEYFEVLK